MRKSTNSTNRFLKPKTIHRSPFNVPALCAMLAAALLSAPATIRAQTPVESYAVDLNSTYQNFNGMGVGLIFYQCHLAQGLPEVEKPGAYDKLFLDVPHEYLMFWFRPNEDTNDNTDPYTVALDNFQWTDTQDCYVEVITEALARTPTTKIVATVMTPPAWLKTNRSIYGGGTLDTSVPNAYEEFGEFVFANLLWYKQQGISVEALTLMNEPDYTLSHEDADYTPAQARDVLKWTVPHIQNLVNSGQNTAGVSMPLIMMPSTLSVTAVNSYVDEFKADSTAWNNTDWVSTHQYGGGMDYNNFLNVYNNINGKFFVMSEWHSANNDLEDDLTELMEQSYAIITALTGNVNTYWWFETAHPGNTVAGLCQTPWGQPPIFGKTYHSWKQWARRTPVGSTRAEVSKIGTGDQLYYVAFDDGNAVTMHILNRSTVHQYVGLSISNQDSYLIERWRTSLTDNFTKQSFIIPSDPAAEVVIQADAKSLSTCKIYYQYQDAIAPAAPTNLTASAGNERIILNWNNNTEPDLAGYNICRATGTGPYSLVADGIAPSGYTDSNLTPGETYYYLVTAVDTSTNESPFSAEAHTAPTWVPPTSIDVTNYSFELPGTEKQIGWENVPGWSSDTVAESSGVETGYTPTDGLWTAFVKGTDPSVWQLTGHTIAAGQEFTLKVDARRTWAATTLQVSLYYDSSGTRVPVATRLVTVDDTMAEYTLRFEADNLPESIGKNIGIEFYNFTGGESWVGLDNVRFTYVVPDTPPAFDEDPFVEPGIREGFNYTGSIADEASDPDAGDTLTFSKVSGHSWLNLAPDGTLSGIPADQHVGLNEFTVRAEDPYYGYDEAVMQITVVNSWTGQLGMDDYAPFASFWQEDSCASVPGCTAADLNADNHVNTIDLAKLADNWLTGPD